MSELKSNSIFMKEIRNRHLKTIKPQEILTQNADTTLLHSHDELGCKAQTKLIAPPCTMQQACHTVCLVGNVW